MMSVMLTIVKFRSWYMSLYYSTFCMFQIKNKKTKKPKVDEFKKKKEEIDSELHCLGPDHGFISL